MTTPEEFIEAAVDTKLDLRIAWLLHFRLTCIEAAVADASAVGGQ